jgi:bifunctional pyridoxal-dependent enzyme with beta-cystathionase and maltose regulon repressor activities
MHYCRHLRDDKNNDSLSTYIDNVDFGYAMTDKEYFEPIKYYLSNMKAVRRQKLSGIWKSKDIVMFQKVVKRRDGSSALMRQENRPTL